MILSALSYIKDKTGYLQEFISDPFSTGSIVPSSQLLCKTMSGAVDWDKVSSVAELGAGGGVLTQHLLACMRSDATLVAFETNHRFCDILNKMKDDRLTVVADSAECMQSGYDAILSSLPLLTLSGKLRHRILEQAMKALNPEGVFVRFQYTPFLEPLLSDYFTWSRTRVIRNLPPALVYRCQVPCSRDDASLPD